MTDSSPKTSEFRTLVEERTPEDGVVRLQRWPEGYVLWHHGRIVWKEWVSVGPVNERAVAYWRMVIRKALSDCSTVDFNDLSDAAIDNMALVAAQAVQRELADV